MTARPRFPALPALSALSSAAVVLDDAERQPCEIWTRVMGYHRPVSSFNIGKQGEFHERLAFREQPLGQR